MIRLIVVCLVLGLTAGCTSLSSPVPDSAALCETLQGADGDSFWTVLKEDRGSVRAVEQALIERAAGAGNKKIVVFLGGTDNTKKTATNVWKL